MSLDEGLIVLPKGINTKKIILSVDGGEIRIPFKKVITGEQTLQVTRHFTEYLSESKGEEYGIYPYNPLRVKGLYLIMPGEKINSDSLSSWELPKHSFYSVPFEGGGIDVSIIRDRLCGDDPELFFEYLNHIKSSCR